MKKLVIALSAGVLLYSGTVLAGLAFPQKTSEDICDADTVARCICVVTGGQRRCYCF